MQYIIMLLIVIGLALADFATGFIKGCITDRPRSAKMRRGGLNKLAEIVVMATAIGLNIGLEQLGKYYDSAQLTDIAGAVTAVSVFGYITVMEIVSIFENYAEINPDAAWISKIIKRLRGDNGERSEKENCNDNNR